MKKILFIGLIFGGLALTSCKKDWVCECTNPDGTTYVDKVIKNRTKNKAKKECRGDVNFGPLVNVSGDSSCDVR